MYIARYNPKKMDSFIFYIDRDAEKNEREIYE